MSARALPPEMLAETAQLFKSKHTRKSLAPKQNGRIAWSRDFGYPIVPYFWSHAKQEWRLVKPNPYKPRPTQLVRVSPASPTAAGWEVPVKAFVTADPSEETGSD